MRLKLPEMLIIFAIAPFMFGPRWLPGIYAKIRPERRPAEEHGYPKSWIVIFGIMLVLAFIYGIVNTLQIFR